MKPEPLKILVVEDIISLRTMFVAALRREFPGAEITGAEHLRQAREALQKTSFDAVVTDCGFPECEKEERLHGNRNGLTLIGEIRRGDYGKKNAIAPIAFNSAEQDAEKTESALRFGGNTKAFRKGAYYPGFRTGNLESNFNTENVTGGTVRWLKEELTEQKMSEREAITNAPVAEDKRGWRGWFGGGQRARGAQMQERNAGEARGGAGR